MVAGLDDEEFAEMLAAIWTRHGWSAEVTERDGNFMVAGEQPDGRRGLILVAPGGSGPVGQEPIETLDSLQMQRGIDVPVAATTASFTDDAREMAEVNGLYLVDPETLEETASAKGFEDLLAQYSSGGTIGRILRAIPVPSLAIAKPRLPPIGGNMGGVIAGALGVLILVVLGLGLFGGSLGGLLGALPIPDLGIFGAIGGLFSKLPIPDLGIFDAIGSLLGALPLPEISLGGGGYSVTAVSLTQGGGTPVAIGWDARTQPEIVGPNGTAFEAPENHTFVVVQLNVTNDGADTLVLEPGYFAFATGQTRYGPQPLAGAQGGLPVVVPALSSTRGYLVFSVPETADSGTLLALPGTDGPPIEFERDRSLEYQVQ